MDDPSKDDKDNCRETIEHNTAIKPSANNESASSIGQAEGYTDNRDKEKAQLQSDSRDDEKSHVHSPDTKPAESEREAVVDDTEGVTDVSQVTNIPEDSSPSENNGTQEDTASKQDDYDSHVDEGDPLPSGTGVVARECDPSDLCGWSDILPRWQNSLDQRPRGLETLVRRSGIPEPLRGEVWQLLSGAHQCQELMDNYRVYLTKPTPAEQIIARDVHRTFPAHENFRPGAGSSSLLDSLFKVCKAYAVYDPEVNYLQSMSFLVAALLLHMPEEQAFCVLVRIMYNYKLRELFRSNFEQLHVKFFQLDKLLQDHHPDLHQHFNNLGIEPFTYANSWFLSLFTAKLPLVAVFRILDILLLDGMDTIFQIALALLGASKKDLLLLDFEGVLKYLRITLPKLYQDQDNVQQLISVALLVDLRRLKKYAKEYEQIKQKEKLIENPISRLQRENAKLTENNLRLESDNDNLTREMIKLKAQLDILEEKTEVLNQALAHSRLDCRSYLNTISDIEDEKSRFEVENSQLKAVCRREMNKAETEINRNIKIVAEYKKISSQLGRRLDFRLTCANQFVNTIENLLRDNESCGDKKCFQIFQSHAGEFLSRLNGDNSDEVLSSLEVSEESRQKTRNPRLVQRMTSSESDYANRPVGAYVKSSDSDSTSSEVKIKQLTQHIDELEVELARTKLALVESECLCQQMLHDNQTGVKVSKGTDSRRQMPTSGSSSNRLNLSAFAKINNIISEKISNISQPVTGTPPPSANSMPNSVSTPSMVNKACAQSSFDNDRNQC